MNKDNKIDDISDLLKQYDKNVNNIINNQEKKDNSDEEKNMINDNLKSNIKETNSSNFIKDDNLIFNEKANSQNEKVELNDSNDNNFTKDDNLIFNEEASSQKETIKLNDSNSSINNNVKTINYNSLNDNNLKTPSNNSSSSSSKNTSNNKIYIGYEIRIGIRLIASLIFIVLFIILMIKYKSYNQNTNEYYSENSQSSYSVCLNENEFYEESCLGENRQYLTKLVKNIPFIFSYNSLYSYQIEKIYEYSVTAHLKIFSQDNESSILYEKIFNLIDKTEFKDKSSVFTIANDVVVPFNEYQNLVTKYNNDYGVLSNSEVVIDFNVNDKSVSSITIPLGKQTFSITKHDTENTVLIDSDLKKTINKNSTLLLICMLISGIAAIISVILSLLYYFKYSNKKDEMTKFRNELKNILKNYDRIIVEVNDVSKLLENKVIIKVENFLELVDVRDTLDKPILHVKINSIKEGFYVEDNDKVYSFIMKAK